MPGGAALPSAGTRGGACRSTMCQATGFGTDLDFVALDDALLTLRKVAPRAEQVVELRCFGGLSIEEAATCLAIAPATVKRDWAFARAWLHRALRPPSRRLGP